MTDSHARIKAFLCTIINKFCCKINNYHGQEYIEEALYTNVL